MVVVSLENRDPIDVNLTHADKASVAFSWLMRILEDLKVPFQVTGGLAARAYGSVRPLADINLDIPEEALARMYSVVKANVAFGQVQFKDENWDLQLMRLDYHGQEIDLGGCFESKVFNPARREWILVEADFKTSQKFTLFGEVVPVIALKDLIEYKSYLRREVDLSDIAEISPK